MSNFAEYQTDHLILLIGSNPLPNFVAGTLLRPPDGTLYLLSTYDTRKVAKNLARQLGGRCIEKEVHSSDPAVIKSVVWSIVQPLRGQSVGLHYTGGTKAMAVHAYLTIQAALDRFRPSPVFSYLDARQLALRIDPRDGRPTGSCISVGLDIALPLDSLLALHGWTGTSQTRAVLPELAEALTAAFSSEEVAQAWKGWFWQKFVKACTLGGAEHSLRWKSAGDLEGVMVSLPNDPRLNQVRSTMQQTMPGVSGNSLSPSEAARSVFGGEVSELGECLKGKWLESAVLLALQKIAANKRLHDVSMNVRPRETDMEIDVVAMRGYQLFLFSCSTTNDKPELKKRLFEASIRARQLGGDEARAILVCPYGDPDRLRSEMRTEFDLGDEVWVYGREDLADLPYYLEYLYS